MEREELTVRIVALILLLLTLGAACGGDDDDDATQRATQQETESATTTATTVEEPEEDAGDFLKEHSERTFLGQYGRIWESLHPDHKAIVSREKFLTCNQDTESFTSEVDIEVVDTYQEPILIQGSGTVDSTAVTLRLSYDNPLTGKPAEENTTVHAVPVDGEWTWILKPADYAAYKKGNCPAES